MCLESVSTPNAVTKNERQKQAPLQLGACSTKKFRAQPNVYLWIFLFQPQTLSPSSPLHLQLPFIIKLSVIPVPPFHWIHFHVSQMDQLHLPSVPTIQADQGALPQCLPLTVLMSKVTARIRGTTNSQYLQLREMFTT